MPSHQDRRDPLPSDYQFPTNRGRLLSNAQIRECFDDAYRIAMSNVAGDSKWLAKIPVRQYDMEIDPLPRRFSCIASVSLLEPGPGEKP